MSSPEPRTVRIFSPVYLDVESFLRLRDNVRAALAAVARLKDLPVTFVAIDDSGGTDPEIKRLAHLTDVTVLATPFNLGHQRALVYGLRKTSRGVADEDIVVTMDADGEDKPEDLPRLLEPLLDDVSNLKRIILARRTKRRESATFKVLYFGFKSLFRLLTGVVVRTGNYSAYRGWAARNVLFHPHFDLCYSSSLISLGLDVAYVPCERGRRYSGRSRMGYLKLLIHGARMLMPFLDRISVRALVAFSGLLGASLVLELAALAGRFFHLFPVPRWAPAFLGATFVLSFVALGNFVVLFAIFSQMQGIALHELDRSRD